MEKIMAILILIGFIGLVIAVFGSKKNENIANVIFSSAVTLIFVSIVCIILMKTETKIEPLEVYRGNTTLQITYQDGVPIDSVVVYKNNINKS